MTDKEVEDIIKSNMNLQMNLAGIRADFEEMLQRTWVGLELSEIEEIILKVESMDDPLFWMASKVEAKLKEKNT